MKRIWAMILTVCLCLTMGMTASAERYYDTESGDEDAALPTAAQAAALSVNAKSAILMEMLSGKVLFEQNSREALPIASVTKVMTLLLVMEAIDGGQLSYDDMITVSATAASMGGSQIWLEENETMSVRDLLKAAVIVSANDACAAFAEHLCGTIDAFVARMNERASELGATDTRFVDCSGLDDGGVSSAYDIALMSRELMMKHPDIQQYTTVWMDSLRGGQSELVNTNRLVRFYNGATGLKTGTTGAAGYCLSATAERDGLPLCAVVLGAPTTNDRFGGARNLLDYGFASYALFCPTAQQLTVAPVPVLHGAQAAVEVKTPSVTGIPVERTKLSSIEVHVNVASDVEAPVEAGQVLGEAVVTAGEEELARFPLTANTAVEAMTLSRALRRFLAAWTVGCAV